MASLYGYIGYTLPDGKPADYAARALAIFDDLERNLPQMLPVFLAANSVLTLSGVRAYDAYHEFYDFYGPAERMDAVALLRNHGVVVMDSYWMQPPTAEGIRNFELLNEDGLGRLVQSYTLPGTQASLPSLSPRRQLDEAHYQAWCYTAERYLDKLAYEGLLPKEWAANWLASHDVRFGMLLGYPAKAIESCIWDGVAEEKWQMEAGGLSARIAHFDSYFAADPRYVYSQELVNDAQLVAHERLWSAILNEVYDSHWHQKVQSNEVFQSALEKIRQIEQAG